MLPRCLLVFCHEQCCEDDDDGGDGDGDDGASCCVLDAWFQIHQSLCQTRQSLPFLLLCLDNFQDDIDPKRMTTM